MYTLSEDLSILLGGYNVLSLFWHLNLKKLCSVRWKGEAHPAPNTFDLGIKCIYADFVDEL